MRSVFAVLILAAMSCASAADEDRAALFAADDAIKHTASGARTVLLEVRDPAAHAATGKVLGEESVFESETSLSVSGVHPWDTMTSQQKVGALQSLVRREAQRVMPALLRAP
jgi:hypothetical protein